MKDSYHYIGFVPFVQKFLKLRPDWHLWIRYRMKHCGGYRVWFCNRRRFGRRLADVYEYPLINSMDITVKVGCSSLQLERIKAACACYRYYREGVAIIIKLPAPLPLCLTNDLQ